MADEQRQFPTPTPASRFGSACHHAGHNYQETNCVGGFRDPPLPTCSSRGKTKFINTRSFCTLSTKLCGNSEPTAEEICTDIEIADVNSDDVNISHSQIANKESDIRNSESNIPLWEPRLSGAHITDFTDSALQHIDLDQRTESRIDILPHSDTAKTDARMGSLAFEKPSSLGFCTSCDVFPSDTLNTEAPDEKQRALLCTNKKEGSVNSNIGTVVFTYELTEPGSDIKDTARLGLNPERPDPKYLSRHSFNLGDEQADSSNEFIHNELTFPETADPSRTFIQPTIHHSLLPCPTPESVDPSTTSFPPTIYHNLLPCPTHWKPELPLRRQLSKRKSEVFEAFLPESAHTAGSDDNDDYEDDADEEYYSVGGSQGRRSDPCTPTTPKTRRLENYDPYQIFEVQHTPCLILTVRVLRGRNITLGFQDYYDTPDPYINLILRSSPEGKKSTTVKENDTNPVWDETFTFYINFTQSNVLEINLMESNAVWFDQKVGTVYYDIVNIREMDRPLVETFVFNKISQVDIEFKLEFDRHPTLRYSLCLSTQEKEFIELRKEKTLEGIRKLLGVEHGPLDVDEVPTVAVIGSGGGFRAMTGYSGVFKALSESGVLDCTMYACGLSGSSWLLSTLYSHPKWPNLDMNEFLDELKHSVDKSLLRFLNASTMYSYMKFMIHKRKEGQPVSFTDIFGRMVGETLLKGRMEATLTDQREKIKDGAIPMPLYTCVHVKKDVPARSFQEWVEFSPYEIGLPKYGTFMDSELFGSKFFMGKLVKQYKEQPLHFLQGIWGSAFCILFKRLLEDNRRIDPVEMVRQEMGKQLDEAGQESSSDCSDDEVDDSTDSVDGENGSPENGLYLPTNREAEMFPNKTSVSSEYLPTDGVDSGRGSNAGVKIPDSKAGEEKESVQSQDYHIGRDNNEEDYYDGLEDNEQEDSAYEGEEEDCEFEDQDDEEEEETEMRKILSQAKKRGSVEMRRARQTHQSSKDSASPENDTTQENIEVPQLPAGQKNHTSRSEPVQAQDLKKSVNWGTCPTLGKNGDDAESKQKRQAFRSATSVRKSRSGSKSYWNQLLKKVFEGNSWELLSTRRGRAAVIHNFMRGLSLHQTYPLSPFTPLENRVKAGDEFDGNFEMHSTSVKHIYMVDAGLTFNSPFPLVLRPQREVDIILSFDFSARDSDNAQPFKELLLAEKWARLNRLPFPPIDTSVFEREGMKELYIFRHPTDPHCPVVLHFVLVNKTFRYYKKPGVPRQTKEEFNFADFDIFDDPKAPYSTFNFTYAHKNFEQLSQLMEFNTLLHIEDIKEVIKEVIKKKREGPPRVPIQSKDIKLLRMKSVQEMRKLRRFISRMESRRSSCAGTSPSTPFFTPTPNSDMNINPFFPRSQSEVSGSPSNDSNNSPIPSDKLADSFSRNSRAKRHIHPDEIFSESEEMNYIESTENGITNHCCQSPTSCSFESVFNRPADKFKHVRHLDQVSSLNKTITNMNSAQSVNVCDGPEEHMSVTECDMEFCPGRNLSSASRREIRDTQDTDFTNQSSIGTSPVKDDKSTSQNVSKSEVNFSDSVNYNQTQSDSRMTDSSEFGSLGAEVSLDGTTVHSSQRGMPGTGTDSTDSTGFGYLEKLMPTPRLKNQTPPNPFFNKFLYMTSSRNSSSPSSSNSSLSSLAGIENGGDKTISSRGVSYNHKSPTSQSSNSSDDVRNTRQTGRLNLRSPRLSPLVVSSSNKSQSPPGVQQLPSPTNLEIFSLAPEAFKSDGTPVFDSQQAKMFYEGAKSKRKFFRRQSTVSSLKSISLDENKPLNSEINADQRGNDGDYLESSNKRTIINLDNHSNDIFQTCDEDRPPSVKSSTVELTNNHNQKAKQPAKNSTGNLDFSDLSQFTGVSDIDMQLVNQSFSFSQDERPISDSNDWYDAEDNTS